MPRKPPPGLIKPAKPPKGDSSKLWLAELAAAEKREAAWRRRARRVVERYRDERDHDGGERRTNILWSNTEILRSVLFQDIGAPDVRRRFPKKGRDEKVARTTALVMERALSASIDGYDAKTQIECAVEDHLLAGRGQAWIVYDADVIEAASESDDDIAEGGPSPIDIADQSVRIEHVYWEDYRTSAGRKESDIWWKARRHQYTRNELKTYFPEHAAYVPLGAESPDAPRDSGESETFRRANVWEIWDKTRKERVYVAEGYPNILRRDEDPYRLRQFFPCPSALYGVKTTSSLVPIPEYTLYQDQCEELDRITTRLNRLIEALKRRGVYDASIDGPDNQLAALATADDNEFVPYKGFAGLLEKGGLKGVFASEDLGPTVTAVQALYQQRQVLIQTIYEITGISDVVRGATNPNETATAQRIKGQFGSLRISARQDRIKTFVRDCFRLKAEIIAEHFTREKLSEMTGIDLPTATEIEDAKQKLAMLTQAQQMPAAPGAPPAPPPPPPDPAMIAELQAMAKAIPWESIESILRSDERRGYKIDIETDSLAAFDEQAEKESRIELLNTMQPVLQNALLMVQQSPEMLPLAREVLMFTIKGFRAGRQLEESFEDAFDQLAQRPPTPPQPDPEQQKVEIEQQRVKAELDIKQALAQQEIHKAELEAQLKAKEIELKHADLQAKQAEMAAKAQQMDLEFLNQAAADEADDAQASQEMPLAADPLQTPVRPPQSQLQQVLTQMVLGFDELRRSNELLARAVTAPKTTKLIRDASGRSVGAVQQTMALEPLGMMPS